MYFFVKDFSSVGQIAPTGIAKSTYTAAKRATRYFAPTFTTPHLETAQFLAGFVAALRLVSSIYYELKRKGVKKP